MRKILSAILVLALLSGIASAEGRKVGILSKLNMSQEEYSGVIDGEKAAGVRNFFSSNPVSEPLRFVYYDTLQAMQLALNAGEIEEMSLPEVVAEYIMNVTGDYKISSISKTRPAYLAFGFRADDAGKELAAKFNEAILAMKEDGTLAVLQAKYIYDAGIGDPESIEFRKFDNVDRKITIAVTGDLPPIDYVTADGNAAGFNTAVIAEIGKRLEANVELIQIMSGARASAVVSGRADAVFWIQGVRDVPKQADMPEGLLISEPYYEWNEYLYLSPLPR
ncbi:MAG: transporter substrate-binding domain-containing protein [Synergistaceae bacterium]|nr:transporter substrate-binding domain-containing protein [Synergistaceae bacterium]